MRFTRRTIVAAGLALAMPGLAAAKGDSFTNEFFGTVIRWRAPWKQGTVFGGTPPGNDSPILNNTKNQDFALFTTTDPLKAFDTIDAFLDRHEEDFTNLFFAPFRDDAANIEIIGQKRTRHAFAVVISYKTPQGRVVDCLDYRHDGELVNSTQLSGFVETFATSFESLQTEVTVNAVAPFTTMRDEDILELVAGLI